MTFINRFKKSYGTFRRGGGKNILSSMTLGQFAQNQKKEFLKNLIFIKNKNDHGVVVSIIIIIYLKYFDNSGILNHRHEIHL